MKKDARKSLFQGPLLYVVLLLVILWMVHLLGTPTGTQPLELSYSSLLQWVEADLKHDEGMDLTGEEQGKTIADIIITQSTLIARTEDSKIPESEFGARYDITSTIPSEEQFYTDVNTIYTQVLGREVSPAEYRFDVTTQLPAGTPWWMELLPIFILVGLMALLYYFVMRSQTGSGKGMASFGKSRARLTDPKANNITFKDVAGADEEKEELREIVEFLKKPRQVHRHRRAYPQGRAARRPARHRQDAACQGRLRRGRGAVFHHLRL